MIQHVPADSGRLYVKARLAGSSDSGASATYDLRITAVRLKPTLALPTVSGPVGSAVNIRLSGFPGEQAVDLEWDGAKQATATTDRDGAVTASVAASAIFTITPSLDLSPAVGVAGQNVTVALNGYKANEKVTITWFNSRKKRVKAATVAASPLGAATATFTVPDSAKAGNHKVRGRGSGGAASGTFSGSPPSAVSPPNAGATTSDAAAGNAGPGADRHRRRARRGSNRHGDGDKPGRAARDQRRAAKQGGNDASANFGQASSRGERGQAAGSGSTAPSKRGHATRRADRCWRPRAGGGADSPANAQAPPSG